MRHFLAISSTILPGLLVWETTDGYPLDFQRRHRKRSINYLKDTVWGVVSHGLAVRYYTWRCTPVNRVSVRYQINKSRLSLSAPASKDAGLMFALGQAAALAGSDRFDSLEVW